MMISHLFQCPKCGLMSVGMADLPEAENPKRKLTLNHECLHCDGPLAETKRLGDWLAEAAGQKAAADERAAKS